jgi:hypothetical protein
MDPSNPPKPAKLFRNVAGATLFGDYREIGNEMSNLSTVG